MSFPIKRLVFRTSQRRGPPRQSGAGNRLRPCSAAESRRPRSAPWQHLILFQGRRRDPRCRRIPDGSQHYASGSGTCSFDDGHRCPGLGGHQTARKHPRRPAPHARISGNVIPDQGLLRSSISEGKHDSYVTRQRTVDHSRNGIAVDDWRRAGNGLFLSTITNSPSMMLRRSDWQPTLRPSISFHRNLRIGKANFCRCRRRARKSKVIERPSMASNCKRFTSKWVTFGFAWGEAVPPFFSCTGTRGPT